MMLPQHQTVVSEFKEVPRLFEFQGHGDSKMWLDMFWHFYVYWGQNLTFAM